MNLKKSLLLTFSIVIVLVVIVNIIISYVQYEKEKSAYYQSISDRLYYYNILVHDKEEISKKISPLIFIDIENIGRKIINLDDFDFFQKNTLCSDWSDQRRDMLISSFLAHKFSQKKETKEYFNEGIQKVHFYCQQK